jgi:hypothetical protein
MVSYFYEAGYNASAYETSEPLLHAQVAIIADKYDCASLYKLAKTSLANTIEAVKIDDWAAIAAFIYDHTTTEAPAHVEVRNLVITAIAGHRSKLRSALGNKSIVDLLRSNADLAADILLAGPDGPKAGDEHVFICDHCHYGHTGSRNCSNVMVTNNSGVLTCLQCKHRSGTKVQRHDNTVNMYPAFFCPVCYGIHTAPPSGL